MLNQLFPLRWLALASSCAVFVNPPLQGHIGIQTFGEWHESVPSKENVAVDLLLEGETSSVVMAKPKLSASDVGFVGAAIA